MGLVGGLDVGGSSLRGGIYPPYGRLGQDKLAHHNVW